MVLTIHQPEFMPWLGFLDKAAMADTIVLLDTVQFRKNYFQNRNKIRTADGFAWLTVPLKSHPLYTRIDEIEINNSGKWQAKCLKSIYYNYHKTDHFRKYYNALEKILSDEWRYLSDLNTALIEKLFEFFHIDTRIIRSSNLGPVSGKKDELLLNICTALSADTYISGISGKDYLSLEPFRENGIEVIFQEFFHPVYQQQFQPFLQCMSSADLLFNHGEKSRSILLDPDGERLEYLIQ